MLITNRIYQIYFITDESLENQNAARRVAQRGSRQDFQQSLIMRTNIKAEEVVLHLLYQFQLVKGLGNHFPNVRKLTTQRENILYWERQEKSRDDSTSPNSGMSPDVTITKKHQQTSFCSTAQRPTRKNLLPGSYIVLRGERHINAFSSIAKTAVTGEVDYVRLGVRPSYSHCRQSRSL